ncbi:MAG TPA: Rrf2 family transcriptional regulator [Thermoanaerobaculia bacterium]|nr:Rrf2 family transcriptional regulator [Thermoanaerobaculia bacterium]
MFFSRAQEVALASLVHLDRRGPAGAGRGVRDLAAAAGVPAPFLSKVLGRLVDRGLLRSRRGRKGGFVLGRPAAEITLADVVLALERKGDLEAAFRAPEGAAAPLFARLRGDFLETLRATSLADVPPPAPPD